MSSAAPRSRTLRDLVEYVLEVTGRRRLIVPLPRRLAALQGSVLGLARQADARPAAATTSR